MKDYRFCCRYQYDPNPKIRDGMTMIWKVLLADPRKAVDEHYKAILDELLKEMGGKLWRNREAACNALADLVQGRSWPEVQMKFEKIWMMAFRALDDVKVTPCSDHEFLLFSAGLQDIAIIQA